MYMLEIHVNTIKEKFLPDRIFLKRFNLTHNYSCVRVENQEYRLQCGKDGVDVGGGSGSVRRKE